MENRKFMERALEKAKEAFADGEIPVGAVVVKDGKIIGEGRNRREKSKTALAHAEIEALHNASLTLGDWRLSGCEMFVTLEPCIMCCGAIINARIDCLVFGAYDEQAGAMISRAEVAETFGSGIRTVGGYMEKECREVLTSFFRNLR